MRTIETNSAVLEVGAPEPTGDAPEIGAGPELRAQAAVKELFATASRKEREFVVLFATMLCKNNNMANAIAEEYYQPTTEPDGDLHPRDYFMKGLLYGMLITTDS